jgi:hypothetical protein
MRCSNGSATIGVRNRDIWWIAFESAFFLRAAKT